MAAKQKRILDMKERTEKQTLFPLSVCIQAVALTMMQNSSKQW